MKLSRTLSLAAMVLLTFPAVTFAADVPDVPAVPLASLRPVSVTADEGQIAALVTPVPVIVTDAVTSRAIVRIDNTSRLAEIVHIEAVDYIVDVNGNPLPAPEGHVLGSAAWYHFDETDFLLPAGTSVDVGLTATPPATAGAGDHSASLNVTVRADRTGLPAATGASAETMLLFRVRLQHRIPGAMPQAPSLRLNATSDGGTVHFQMLVNNGGNTVLSYQGKPQPELVLFNTSPWGNANTPEQTLPVEGFYVGPASERALVVNWSDGPIYGSYRVQMTLPGIDGLAPVSAETTFTTVNVAALLTIAGVGVALVLVGVAGLWWWRRRATHTAVDTAKGAQPLLTPAGQPA